MNKFLKVLLILLCCFMMCSCSNNPQNKKDPNNELPQIAESFINSVKLIDPETVTLESKDQINLCIMLYSCLEETSIELLENEEVELAKSTLDNLIEKFKLLLNDRIQSNEKESLINAFIDSVSLLPEIDFITIEDLSKILICESNYNILSDELKKDTNVVTAKAKLDIIREEYNVIISLDTDAYNARKFVQKVNSLPSIDKLTIEDLNQVEKINALYDLLTETHTSSESVINAKTLFDSYSTKVNELKVAQEHATNFIMAVFSLPTGSELKYQNVEQKLKIDDAFNLYNLLTDFEKSIIGVSEAYSELNIVKNYYEGLKEPYDISKIVPTNLCLYYYDGPKKLTFESGKDPRSVLISEYGLTEENIKDNVIVYLDVYIEGGAIKGSSLFSIDITENYDVTVDYIVERLIELKNEGNDSIKSQGYTFTIHIVSLNDQYGNSEYSNFFSSTNFPIS